ncbi:sideroflexin-2-like [Acanthaster planci]|uniref:Sidoreflexin n=1 Tax=Acanthaster planci TaxID=133434 RepID=A0A8B7XL66_ACAPL|nr:sideroflexin-2-like [Acanthaster planci]XP_022080700.1 sideroflexin-2-like [Acanthaster planci]XP_022080701.1 sideroflexin-2-like [Acanthaster planci]
MAQTLATQDSVVASTGMGPRLDLSQPRWDQTTFVGRLKHFFNVTDPRTVICSDKQLYAARDLINDYKVGLEPPGTTEEQLWYAQKLYMSAFHPDSGEKMNLIGKMSFQVPGGMAITGAMLQWYKTMPAVVFWQWINQSFNALVNYTNRNAASSITNREIGLAYVTATSSALVTALSLNSLTKKSPPLIARYVPFAAVAAANCVNIPMMRQKEIVSGIVVCDEKGRELGKSKKAARKGITQVVTSRIIMAAPGMCVLPVIMERLLRYPWFRRVSVLHGPFQVMAVGCFLLFMTPTACALFPQRCSMAVSNLEPDLQASIRAEYGDAIQRVYFNKGL